MTAAGRNETGNYLAVPSVEDLNLEMRQITLPLGRRPHSVPERA